MSTRKSRAAAKEVAVPPTPPQEEVDPAQITMQVVSEALAAPEEDTMTETEEEAAAERAAAALNAAIQLNPHVTDAEEGAAVEAVIAALEEEAAREAPDTAAIIERESRGEGAPAAPPLGPQPSAEEMAAAIEAAARTLQEETGLELPAGIPLPHLVWNSTLNKPVDAHKACGTEERPCTICAVRRERGENGAVIDKYLRCVIYPGTEKPKGGTPAREKALTPRETALAAVKAGAGAEAIPATVMDPTLVAGLLAMGRPVLIAALEAQVKVERTDKQKRQEALREAARQEYEAELARAEEEYAAELSQIAELEAELAPLQERVAELEWQIGDLRSSIVWPEKPAILGGTERATTEGSPKAPGTRRAPRRDNIVYDDQRYKVSPTYQAWDRFRKRFADMKDIKQKDLTRIARAHGFPLKSLDEIDEDMLDALAAYVMDEME